jgi:hypothetical protein
VIVTEPRASPLLPALPLSSVVVALSMEIAAGWRRCRVWLLLLLL